MTRLLAALAVLCALGLAGCAAVVDEYEETDGSDVIRWRDPEHRVVCWGTPVGISCLPEPAVEPR